jgi:hypothetical protein
MTDLKLDANEDLAIEENDLVLIDGLDAIAQDMQTRLQIFQGEWFLDTRIGVPWFQKILGTKGRLLLVKSVIRKSILTTPGVINILDLNFDFEGSTRLLSISGRCGTEEGEFEFTKEIII